MFVPFNKLKYNNTDFFFGIIAPTVFPNGTKRARS